MKLKGKILMTSTVFTIFTVLVLFYSQSHVRARYTEELLSATSDNISNNYIEQARHRVSITLNYLVDAIVEPMYFFDLDGIRYVIEPVTNDENIQKVMVFDQYGKIFHSSDNDDRYGQKVDLPELERMILELGVDYSRSSQELLMLAAPLKLQDQILGGVLVTYSMESVRKDILNHELLVLKLSESNESLFYQLNIVVFIIIFVISLCLSLSLANRLIKPIYLLRDHSKRLQAGNYGTYNTVYSRDELNELAQSINDVDIRLEQRTNEIEFLAFHDSLTKLPNRVTFINHVQSLIKRNEKADHPFSILFIDLDGFKRVNDSFGHQAGDELLCAVATRISALVNDINHHNIVARVGGDEFVVCLHENDALSFTVDIAEALLEMIHMPILLSGSQEEFFAGASIGIARFSSIEESAEALIKKSDLAMYSAKAMGKNCYRFYSKQLEDSLREAEIIEKELKLAMTTYQDFSVWYQPKVRIDDGAVTGYEALIRWKHPSKGFISPETFIPIAESTGLIVDLGKWVIKQVMRDFVHYEHFSEFTVAINISAKQLRDKELIVFLEQQIKAFEIDPSRLQFEVTETSLMENWQIANETLMQIRELGVEIWLDDFGTGYASLSYLQKLPVDGLKIDRSFVSGQNLNLKNNVLCSAMISMARKLSIQVVAEGIETKEQAEFLKSEHCEFGQGFYFFKPKPAEALAAIKND